MGHAWNVLFQVPGDTRWWVTCQAQSLPQSCWLMNPFLRSGNLITGPRHTVTLMVRTDTAMIPGALHCIFKFHERRCSQWHLNVSSSTTWNFTAPIQYGSHQPPKKTHYEGPLCATVSGLFQAYFFYTLKFKAFIASHSVSIILVFVWSAWGPYQGLSVL